MSRFTLFRRTPSTPPAPGRRVALVLLLAVTAFGATVAGVAWYVSSRNVPHGREARVMRTESNSGDSDVGSRKTDVHTTFDLAFHDLRGPVRYLRNQHGQEFYFDRHGRWTNDDYSDQLTDREWVKDSDGRRIREYYIDTDGNPGVMYHHWNEQDLVDRVTDPKRGWTSYRSYDAAGDLSSTDLVYDADMGKPDVSLGYTHYRRDSHGNWISRRCGSTEQTRTIAYY